MSKILLVDDEPKVLRALSAALEDDYDIHVSESCSEAKSTINSKGPFDVIITDEVMPGNKGHDLLNWCRTNAPKAKLMMLTGLPITEELKQNLNAANDVSIFTKPWNLDALKDAFPAHTSNSDTTDQPVAKKTPGNRILVLENSDRYRAMYSQLKGKYYDDVIFLDDVKALLGDHEQQRNVTQIALNVEHCTPLETTFFSSIAQRFPRARILVTAPPLVVNEINHLKGLPNDVAAMAQPFSLERLSSKLKPKRR